MEFSKLLRAKVVSPAEDLEEAIDSPEFWNQLVALQEDAVSSTPFSSSSRSLESLKESGIANFGHLLDATHRQQVIHVVEAISRRRWPKACVILSDVFWALLQSPKLLDSLQHILGADFRMAPRLWLTEVTGHRGAQGWRPHLDAQKAPKLDKEGLPYRLTAWCALTDATTENGCIHILDSDQAGAFPRHLFSQKTFKAKEVMSLLQSARAMPAKAGEVLLWSKDIVHWGGRVSGSPERARLSITTEFVAHDTKREAGEPAFIRILEKMPSFEERRRLLAYSILKYAKYEEEKYRLSSFIPLAKKYF